MKTKKAYLHFGGPFTDNQPCARLTIETTANTKYLLWQERGLSYTATGYGSKIPTSYMVRYNNRWHRVYCAVYSNNGTCYIISKGKPVATVDIY